MSSWHSTSACTNLTCQHPKCLAAISRSHVCSCRNFLLEIGIHADTGQQNKQVESPAGLGKMGFKRQSYTFSIYHLNQMVDTWVCSIGLLVSLEGRSISKAHV